MPFDSPFTPSERRAGYFEVDDKVSAQAGRAWWDAEAATYAIEHGGFLGDRDLVWGPEGWSEEDLHILGDIAGKRVLEFGAGSGAGARWCHDHGAQSAASDISGAMLRSGSPHKNAGSPTLAGSKTTTADAQFVQADARHLPFAEASFDVVFSAYGAVPFIADTANLMRELARVCAPGGRVAFSLTHPIRWCFPDVPGAAGLTAQSSYFDTTPYAEAEGPHVTYVEHHRTLEGRIAELLAAGLQLTGIRELPWNPANTETWGGWSPERGAIIPGTLILVAQKPRETTR